MTSPYAEIHSIRLVNYTPNYRQEFIPVFIRPRVKTPISRMFPKLLSDLLVRKEHLRPTLAMIVSLRLRKASFLANSPHALANAASPSFASFFAW